MKVKILLRNKKKQYVRSKNEINKNLKDKKSKYCKNDIAEKMVKNCRSIKGNDKLNKENQTENFRELLGFKENEIFETKEYSIIKTIKKYLLDKK